MNAAIKLLTTFALNTLLVAKYIVLMANKGKILEDGIAGRCRGALNQPD